MDALDEKQSIAICLIDLATGFVRKFGTADFSFVLKCCRAALAVFPNYINGLYLKAETLKLLVEKEMELTGIHHLDQFRELEQQKELFNEMEATYLKMHDLGYREKGESQAQLPGFPEGFSDKFLDLKMSTDE